MSDAGDRVLPPCGMYKTGSRLGDIPAGRLVYFHNHGDPSPAVFLPDGWIENRARFSSVGVSIPGDWWAVTLDALAPEGFYRVREAFTCCEKNCRQFHVDQLVQLGYTAEAEPIVFEVSVIDLMLEIPDEGTPISRARISKLAPLKTHVRFSDPKPP